VSIVGQHSGGKTGLRWSQRRSSSSRPEVSDVPWGQTQLLVRGLPLPTQASVRPPAWPIERQRSTIPMYGARARVGAGRHCSIAREDPAARRVRTGSRATAPAWESQYLAAQTKRCGEEHRSFFASGSPRPTVMVVRRLDVQIGPGHVEVRKADCFTTLSPHHSTTGEPAQLNSGPPRAGAVALEPVRALRAAGSSRAMEQ
jgi:hypothetical protein